MEIKFASKLNLLTLHLRQILNNLCIFCILINVLFSTSKERNKKKQKQKRKPNILNYFNNYTYINITIYICVPKWMTSLTRPFYLMPLMLTEESEKMKKKPKKQKKYKTNTNLQWKLQASHTHTHTDSHTPYTELRIREFCIANTHTCIHKCTHTHTLVSCSVFSLCSQTQK